jgi:uncharacterized protein YutE (UPF0331/DUF86 family)
VTAFDRDLLAAKTAAVERHLSRVAAKLPAEASELKPSSDASDAVVLHLWQAVQLVLDVAFAACLHRKLPTPGTYGEAFRMLVREGIIDDALAERLSRAAGFRNLVAYAYEALDMAAVHAAAKNGPADLRAFLAAMVKSAVD